MSIDLSALDALMQNLPPKPVYPELEYLETAFGSITHRNKMIRLPDIQASIENLRSENYVSIYRFLPRTAELVRDHGTVAGLSPQMVWSDFIWIDIDNSDDLSSARESALEIFRRLAEILGGQLDHVRLYFSGAKGFHIGIPSAFADLKPRADLPAIQKRVVKRLCDGVDVDLSIYGQTRLLRVPNTLNSKSGLYKIPITYEQLSRTNIEEIKNMAAKPIGKPFLDLLFTDVAFKPVPALVELTQEESEPTGTNSNSIKPCQQGIDSGSRSGWIAKTLANVAPGRRHRDFSRVIGRLLRDGHDIATIRSLLESHAKRVDFASEFNGLLIDLAKRYGNSSNLSQPNVDKTKNEFRAVPLREFLDKTDPNITWDVQGLIAAQTAAIFGGYPGAGKSFLLMELALAVSTGTNFLDCFPTRQGTVLYIDEENAPQLIATRFNALLKGRSLLEAPSSIKIAVAQNLEVDTDAGLQHLARSIQEFRPSIVIVDSFIRIHRAEENSAKEMSRVHSNIKYLMNSLNVSFVFADHVRKQSGKNQSAGLALRGSSDKWAFVDSLISVSKNQRQITVSHVKSRFAEPQPPVVVNLSSTEQGAIELVFDHQLTPYMGDSKLDDAIDFVLDLVTEKWISRKEVQTMAEENSFNSGVIDRALRELVDRQELELEKRNKPGRGAPQNFYRRTPNVEEAA